MTKKYQYNSNQTAVIVTDGDERKTIPVDLKNSDYAAIIDEDVTIADYTPPPIPADFTDNKHWPDAPNQTQKGELK